MIYIEVGSLRPDTRGLDVVINQSIRDQFLPSPEVLFKGRTICARGPVSVIDGRAQIFPGARTDVAIARPIPVTPQVPGGYCDQPIPWTDASQYDQQTVDIEGPVVGVRQEDNVNGHVLIIEVGRAKDAGQGFDVAIEASALGNFDPNPAAAYVGKTICVQGAITIVNGRPRTYVDVPRGIFLRP